MWGCKEESSSFCNGVGEYPALPGELPEVVYNKMYPVANDMPMDMQSDPTKDRYGMYIQRVVLRRSKRALQAPGNSPETTLALPGGPGRPAASSGMSVGQGESVMAAFLSTLMRAAGAAGDGNANPLGPGPIYPSPAIRDAGNQQQQQEGQRPQPGAGLQITALGRGALPGQNGGGLASPC